MSAAAPAVPFRGSGPFLAKAPPFSLPMRHFVFAAGAFAVFAAAFAWGHARFLGFAFDARWVLGLTHTLTLGWTAMTLLGALCQLTPVLWETSLAWEPLAEAAWWLLAGGILAFVGLLWSGSERYWLGALAVAAAVALYLAVYLRTMRAAARLDWTGLHLANGLLYLALLAAFGLALAWDRQRGLLFRDPGGALIAHVHLALVGWVTLSIMGVSYRLVPLFSLAHLEDPRPGRLALGLANAGLVGLAADAAFLGRRWTPFWAVLLAAGYACYLAPLRRLLRQRPRRVDPPLAFTFLALLGGAAWTALGLGLGLGLIADETENRLAYAFCALVGWVTPYIMGQAHKIVPFLVWLHVYSPRAWTPPVKVPVIADLTSERLAWAELAALAAGWALGTAGFLIRSEPVLRAGGLGLAACAFLYMCNTGISLKHVLWLDPRWTKPFGKYVA